ncbi:MAG: MoaD/ThiS family protein [Thermodesulfobacteriota bacterium]
MPRVKIRSYFSLGLTETLRSCMDKDQALIIEIEPGAKVADLIERLSLLGPTVTADDVAMFVFVNGEPRTLDHPLEPGDVLDIHVPAMGG